MNRRRMVEVEEVGEEDGGGDEGGEGALDFSAG